ncbi:MAG: hypothetical protein KI790_17805 [Cyclobacteriaceae bacterium]|nr:hypothetical protein [Cyclobacteriaceae bacterium HetDA_MAG_MS6]
MAKWKRLWCLLLALGLSIIVAAQKREIKQGLLLEQQGRVTEAAEQFIRALHKNRYKTEAVEGLSRTSQSVLDAKVKTVHQAYRQRNFPEVIDRFEDIEQYIAKIAYFQITLEVPAAVTELVENSRMLLLKDHYSKGVSAMDDGNYPLASENFLLVERLDPQYQDIQSRLQELEILPDFDQAQKSFEDGRYGIALQFIEEVLSNQPNYMPAVRMRDQIGKLSDTPIAILPATTNRFGIDDKIRSHLVAAFLSLNNPMIRIVDRDNLGQVIDEQKRMVSGIIGQASAVEIGELLGAKYLLLTKVLNADLHQSPPTNQDLTAYVARTEMNSSGYPQVAYYPVKYQETSKTNTVHLTYQYQLVSTETGEVLAADVISETKQDEWIEYRYEGDPSALYPAKNGVIFKDPDRRGAFQARFGKRSSSPSISKTSADAQRLIADRIAASFSGFLSSR